MKKVLICLFVILAFMASAAHADKLRLKLNPDGTVIDYKTGIIYHRNPKTPGVPHTVGTVACTAGETGPNYINMFEYIDNLNAGVYGTDPINGNAGYTDWRIATLKDLCCLYDPMQNNLKLPSKWEPDDPNIPVGPAVYADPFMICNWFDGPEVCPEEHQMWDNWITNTPCVPDDTGWAPCQIGVEYTIIFGWATEIWSDGFYGEVWPVRGP